MLNITKVTFEIPPQHRDAYNAGRTAANEDLNKGQVLSEDDLDKLFIDLGILRSTIQKQFAEGATRENIL